jgi:hypothetical protein
MDQELAEELASNFIERCEDAVAEKEVEEDD